jgi:predicted  nucleic acid-binding Zn-ribbon protein
MSLESSRQVTALQKEVDESKNREEHLNQQLKSLQTDKAQIQSELQESQTIVKSLYPHV